MSHPLCYAVYRKLRKKQRTKRKTKVKIELIENETKAIIDGANTHATRFNVTHLHAGDHEGHEYLTVDIEGHGEFISYDDGQTFSEMY